MSSAAGLLPYTIKEASVSGVALRENRRSLGISREVFAPIGGISVRSLASYESDKEVPKIARRAVTEGMRLAKALMELVDESKNLKTWLEAENPAFDGRTPMQVIKEGETDLIWEMIHQLRRGSFA